MKIKPKYIATILIAYSIYFPSIILGQDKSTLNNRSQSQHKQHQELRSFYGKTLQLDSVKADKVAEIQRNYKADLNALMADTTIRPALKQVKIQALMDHKNLQLKKMLTPAQQEKIIPVSERVLPIVKKD